MYHFTPNQALGRADLYNENTKVWKYYSMPPWSCYSPTDKEFNTEVAKLCKERHSKNNQQSKYKGSTVTYVTGKLPEKYSKHGYVFTLYDAAYLFDPCKIRQRECKPPKDTAPPATSPPPVAPPTAPPKQPPKQTPTPAAPPPQAPPKPPPPPPPPPPQQADTPQDVFVPSTPQYTPTYTPPVQVVPTYAPPAPVETTPVYLDAVETRYDPRLPEQVEEEPEEEDEDDSGKLLWVGGILAFLAVGGGVYYVAKNRKKKKR